MVVRMRATRAHRDNRRAHFTLSVARLSKCKDCGASHIRHHVCENCGKYKGIQIIDVDAKLARKEKRLKAKEKAVGR